MRKVYLLVYNYARGSRDTLKEWADKSSLVITWRYDLPNCFYLISEASAHDLDADLQNKLGKRGRYIIAEITDNRQGLLPPKSWQLMRDKKP